MATAKKESTTVNLPVLKLNRFTLKIVGDSPLISHAWSQKAKLMILNKQQKKATNGKEVRRPMVDFAESLYWLTPKPDLDGLTDEQAADVLAKIIPQSKFGFPTIGFKAAALDGGFQQGALAAKAGTAALAKTTARGAFQTIGEFAVIEGTPTPREDMVRIGMGTADIRYRGEFKTWATTLDIDYNPRSISIEQIVNLMNMGGFSNGIGEWRPSKDGSFGTFHVAATGEV